MNAKNKKQSVVNTFDGKLKDALLRCRSLNPIDRQRLYAEINKICQGQVMDCVDGICLANLIALHRLEGYGKKRINRFIKTSQTILDDAVEKYDLASVQGLRQRLKNETGLTYELNSDRDVKP